MKYAYLVLFLVATSVSVPYSCADEIQQADNTGRNVRDINSYNPTAQDSSNRKSAIKTTARLRREIMRTKGLSLNAQNIKIIDENGCVTLRGPVDNEKERLTISDLARQCCGENVKDELEVKNP